MRTCYLLGATLFLSGCLTATSSDVGSPDDMEPAVTLTDSDLSVLTQNFRFADGPELDIAVYESTSEIGFVPNLVDGQLVSLTVSYAGQDFVLTEDDVRSDGHSLSATINPEASDGLGDGNIEIWLDGATWDELTTAFGTSTYVAHFGVYAEIQNGTLEDVPQYREGVFGYQTPAADLPVSGTATYSGSLFGHSIRAIDPRHEDHVFGDAEFLVAFEDQSVEGAFTNIVVADPRDAPYALPIDFVFAATPINDGGFDADLEVAINELGELYDIELEDLPASGNVEGNFYGPEGQEVGGTIYVEILDETADGFQTEAYISGSFTADAD